MATSHGHLSLAPGTLNSQWRISYQNTGPSKKQEADWRGQTEGKSGKQKIGFVEAKLLKVKPRGQIS